jgi:D-alanyl-D-alanine carboxypeptidase
MPFCTARARSLRAGAVVILSIASVTSLATAGSAATTKSADAALDAALSKFVASDLGPPSIVVVVQRGSTPEMHAQGVANVSTGAKPGIDDHMRLASVAKAFTGAVALSVVADKKLDLDDTIGKWRPDLPSAWSKVTLTQLMAHTSGIADFGQAKAFGAALSASLLVAPPPVQLLSYVADEPLLFTPGSKYAYSNSDNVIVGLMVETATGHPFTQELATRVAEPLELTGTTLPAGVAIPTPYIHGYAVDPTAAPEDQSEVFAAGWAWTSGGILATPGDANRFIRAYVPGKTTNPATRKAQFQFRAGSSEPPGPGANSAGLSIFRYQTSCGTVYGHTGNTPGYTQFVSATADGSRSATVSVGAQMTPKSDAQSFAELRKIYGLAVCAALAG